MAVLRRHLALCLIPGERVPLEARASEPHHIQPSKQEGKGENGGGGGEKAGEINAIVETKAGEQSRFAPERNVQSCVDILS